MAFISAFFEEFENCSEEMKEDVMDIVFQLFKNKRVSLGTLKYHLRTGRSENFRKTLDLTKQFLQKVFNCQLVENRCDKETDKLYDREIEFSLANRPSSSIPACLAKERNPLDQDLLATLMTIIMSENNRPVKASDMWYRLGNAGYIHPRQDPNIVADIFNRITKKYVEKNYLKFTWPQSVSVPTVDIGSAVKNLSIPQLLPYLICSSPEVTLAAAFPGLYVPFTASISSSICSVRSCFNYGIPHNGVPGVPVNVLRGYGGPLEYVPHRECLKFGLKFEFLEICNEKNQTGAKVWANVTETETLRGKTSSATSCKQSHINLECIKVEREEGDDDSKPLISLNNEVGSGKRNGHKCEGSTSQYHPGCSAESVMSSHEENKDYQVKIESIKIEREEDYDNMLKPSTSVSELYQNIFPKSEDNSYCSTIAKLDDSADVKMNEGVANVLTSGTNIVASTEFSANTSRDLIGVANTTDTNKKQKEILVDSSSTNKKTQAQGPKKRGKVDALEHHDCSRCQRSSQKKRKMKDVGRNRQDSKRVAQGRSSM